ncbi:MAG: hypothetical protein Q7V62_15205, partial [Actinomycetota bacterium]|nr:hypothetical protein [Actinomycetota bacterium]
NWAFADGADQWVDGGAGTDSLIMAATDGTNDISFSTVSTASTTFGASENYSNTLGSTTLTRDAVIAQISVMEDLVTPTPDITLVLDTTAIENVSLNAMSGADTIVVNDLATTAVRDISFNAGVSNGSSGTVAVAAVEPVLDPEGRQYVLAKATTTATESTQFRQSAGGQLLDLDGKRMLISADGSSLVAAGSAGAPADTIASWVNVGGGNLFTGGHEVQKVTITTLLAASGSFKLSFNGVQSQSIPFPTVPPALDAAAYGLIADAMEGSLFALLGPDAVEVTYTGTAGEFAVTFSDQGNQAQLQAVTTSLVGATVTTATTTEGSMGTAFGGYELMSKPRMVDFVDPVTGASRLTIDPANLAPLAAYTGVPSVTASVVDGIEGVAGSKETQQLVIANVSGGSFTLSVGNFTTDAIAWSATDATLAANIQAALDETLTAGKVIVTAGAADTFSVAFQDDGNQPLIVADLSKLTSEQQTLSFSGVAGGTFKLTVGADTTGNIAWSADNDTLKANIQAALNSTLGTNQVIVTAGTVGGTFDL